MADAKRDNNYIPTALGVLDSDGTTPTRIEADPTTHSVAVDDDTTGSDAGPNRAQKDSNKVATLMAASSSGDGTPVTLFIDSSGFLLVDST